MSELALPTMDAFGDQLQLAAAASDARRTTTQPAKHDDVRRLAVEIDLDAVPARQPAHRRRWRYSLAAIAAIALMIASTVGVTRLLDNDAPNTVVSGGPDVTLEPDQNHLDRHVLVGLPAPELAGTDSNGGAFDLRNLDARWRVVTFTSAVCLPCTTLFGEVSNWAAQKDPSEIVAVSVVIPDASAAQIDAQFGGVHQNQIVLTGFDSDRTVNDYLVDLVPTTFIIDEAGTIRAVIDGGTFTTDDLDAQLASLGD